MPETAPRSLDEAVTAALRDVEVRRSGRRVRTVTAFREGGRTVVAIPARFTRTQEREWVHRMVTRLAVQDQRRRPSDAQLEARSGELSQRYLGGRARPASIVWSTRQGRRWGSCTPAEARIRISTRLQGMPSWVLDYVILHELAHLLHSGHGPEFWALLDAYPRTERARGYLEGYAFAVDDGRPPHDDGELDDSDDEDLAVLADPGAGPSRPGDGLLF
ncbi:MAG TPA: M48 family metallopeptidase [Actinotalea sp.]|nr:M48 family metallopeptidase [Actinotalea sp.]